MRRLLAALAVSAAALFSAAPAQAAVSPTNFKAETFPTYYSDSGFQTATQHVHLSWDAQAGDQYKLYRRVFKPDLAYDSGSQDAWSLIYSTPCNSNDTGTADDETVPAVGTVWQYKVTARDIEAWCANPGAEQDSGKYPAAGFYHGYDPNGVLNVNSVTAGAGRDTTLDPDDTTTSGDADELFASLLVSASGPSSRLVSASSPTLNYAPPSGGVTWTIQCASCSIDNETVTGPSTLLENCDATDKAGINHTNGTGPDCPIEILDPATSDELRLFQAEPGVPTTHDITVTGGSLLKYNNDNRTPYHDDPFNDDPCDEALDTTPCESLGQEITGANTGSGLTYNYGIINPLEVAEGRINHVIRIAYAQNFMKDAERLPARQFESKATGTGTYHVPTGTILRLEQESTGGPNCNTITLPSGAPSTDDPQDNTTSGGVSLQLRFLRIVCHAFQDYGAIVNDSAGDNKIALYRQSFGPSDTENNAEWEKYVGSRGSGCGSIFSILRSQGSTWHCQGSTSPTNGIPATEAAWEVVQEPYRANDWVN